MFTVCTEHMKIVYSQASQGGSCEMTRACQLCLVIYTWLYCTLMMPNALSQHHAAWLLLSVMCSFVSDHTALLLIDTACSWSQHQVAYLMCLSIDAQHHVSWGSHARSDVPRAIHSLSHIHALDRTAGSTVVRSKRDPRFAQDNPWISIHGLRRTYLCMRTSFRKCPHALIHWTVQYFTAVNF